jgi:hypothetical protein
MPSPTASDCTSLPRTGTSGLISNGCMWSCPMLAPGTSYLSRQRPRHLDGLPLIAAGRSPDANLIVPGQDGPALLLGERLDNRLLSLKA